jgi:hypothetical protein
MLGRIVGSAMMMGTQSVEHEIGCLLSRVNAGFLKVRAYYGMDHADRSLWSRLGTTV